MRSHALFVLLATALVASLLYQPDTKAASPTAVPALRAGHLIVQLEGTVENLAVTWITPKADAHNPRRLKSAFELCQLDAAGRLLDRQPLDLSRFNLDPRAPGLRVEGCEVIDSKIVTICNIPYLAATQSLEIRHKRRVIGRLGAADYAGLLRRGEVR